MPAIITQREPAEEIWTSEKGSMARETAIKRWPGIVQNMIDDLGQTLAQPKLQEQQADEGQRIQAALRSFKDEISQDKPLQKLEQDGHAETDGYNGQLEHFGKITWHNAPWLFAECYLYRYVHTLFSRSTHWQTYDIFARQKLSALVASQAAIVELCERYESLSSAFSTNNTHGNDDNKDYRSGRHEEEDDQAAALIFSEMTQIALWGNATDLSLLSHLSLDQIHSLQGTQAIEAGQARIVSNDMTTVWEYLRALCDADTSAGADEGSRRRIDIVLDNSGFELFTDLVFALYLLDSQLATEIRLHVKSIPWFVSDVMPHDVDVLLDTLLADNESGDEKNASPVVSKLHQNSSVCAVATRLKEALLSNRTGQTTESMSGGDRGSGKAGSKGAISIAEHAFWTTGYDFQQMPAQAPDLLAELARESKLVIFKGDLNYRKLVRDAKWEHSLPFKQALGPLVGDTSSQKTSDRGGKAGMKILALRTNKADVCVGVDRETLQRVEKEAPGKAWVRSGRYAVVSFSDGIMDA